MDKSSAGYFLECSLAKFAYTLEYAQGLEADSEVRLVDHMVAVGHSRLGKDNLVDRLREGSLDLAADPAVRKMSVTGQNLREWAKTMTNITATVRLLGLIWRLSIL